MGKRKRMTRRRNCGDEKRMTSRRNSGEEEEDDKEQWGGGRG